MFKKIPDTLIIVFSILVVMTILTWVVPAGEYDRISAAGRNDVVVAGSYHEVESSPQNIWNLLQAPFKGFTEASKILAFVLLVGGAFALLMATGALDVGLKKLILIAGNKRSSRVMLLSLLIFLFSLCGFTFGMSEESLVFILFTIPMAYRMGYDSIVGVAIPFVSSGIGGAAAAYNPFSVGVAMDIAGLPFPSGVAERTILWLILTTLCIVFILRYAFIIEKSPEKSVVFNLKTTFVAAANNNETFNLQRIIVILLFITTLVIIPFGAKDWDWGVTEIGAVFLLLGLLSAFIMRMKGSDIVHHFVEGAKGMMTAALVICISRSVLVVVRDGHIIDTILFNLASTIQGLPKEASISLMFVVQGVINFFIPSGSGQAAITMPIMAPLADLLDISRNSAVMAFQLAAGYFDLIIPTSGVTMGVLSVAKISYNIWLKWIWKFMVLMCLVAIIALMVLVQ